MNATGALLTVAQASQANQKIHSWAQLDRALIKSTWLTGMSRIIFMNLVEAIILSPIALLCLRERERAGMEFLQWRLLPLLMLLASLIVFFYIDCSSKPSLSDCSLLNYNHYWITSKRIVTLKGTVSGAVEIKGGNIVSLVKEEAWHGRVRSGQVIDYGEAVVMPGLIDV